MEKPTVLVKVGINNDARALCVKFVDKDISLGCADVWCAGKFCIVQREEKKTKKQWKMISASDCAAIYLVYGELEKFIFQFSTIG